MGKTKIEWTEYSWNPVTGCTPASEGCQNCYAKRMANRLAGRCGYPADEPFRVTLHRNRLNEPLKWKKPRKVFVCSMSDLFHDDVPDEYIAKVWEVMNNANQHTFMVLTKRPQRMKGFLSRLGWYTHDLETNPAEAVLDGGGKYTLPHVWLGVTAENQKAADERIPILLEIPATVRFVSVEPMLGPVDLSYYLPRKPMKDCSDEMLPYYNAHGFNWVVCGGETGPGARPMHPDWVRSLRDQCTTAGVPFFFKNWGEWAEIPTDQHIPDHIFHRGPAFDGLVWRVGRKKAGRVLDGRTWDEIP